MILVGEMLRCIPSDHWPHDRNCHLFCDGDLDELHRFARRLRLRRSWFQADASMPHYDLTADKRRQALSRGAVEADMKMEAWWIRWWRQQRNEPGQLDTEIRQATEGCGG